MSKRGTIFLKGEYYHLYNRGVNRNPIFMDDRNYEFLLKRIRKYFRRDTLTMIAYCLMPNHYHFLVRQDGDILVSDTIQAIFNSYTKAINKLYLLSGTLFESRFKSIHISETSHLLHLCRYIHLNPVSGEKPLVKSVENWPYSNLPDWIGISDNELVDRQFIKEKFGDSENYLQFLYDFDGKDDYSDNVKYFID